MVEISDIKDRDSLREWLETLPFDEDENRRIAVNIAHRTAMRVLPDIWNWSISRQEDFVSATLQILRASLTSQAANAGGTIGEATVAIASEQVSFGASVDSGSDAHAFEVCSLIRSAALTTFANPVARSVADAISAAPYTIDSIKAEFWAEIRHDCTKFQQNCTLLDESPLWSTQNPYTQNPYVDVWIAVLQNLPEGWEFWRDWYQDALDGVKPNWDMLEEIALIDPEDWDKGAAHVNGLIAGIVEEFSNASGSKQVGVSQKSRLVENAKVIRLQLDTLKLFVEEEVRKLREPNDISDAAMKRIVLLEGIVTSVETIQTAFADETTVSENALVVVDENLPQVIEAANELADQDHSTEVSETIVVMGASIDYLTKRGTPGYLATGIAALDVVRSGLRNWFKRRGSSKD